MNTLQQSRLLIVILCLLYGQSIAQCGQKQTDLISEQRPVGFKTKSENDFAKVKNT